MNKNFSFILQVHKDLCTGCGLCAGSCAYNAIHVTEYPEIDPFTCRLCKNCVQTCPSGALVIAQPEKHPGTPVTASHGIWVLAETDENGELIPGTKELLGQAAGLSRKRNQQVEALSIGHHITDLPEELIKYGADRVHLIDAGIFGHFIEENYTRAIAELITKLHPDILLVSATPKGRGLSARLAAILQTGLTADCTGLDIDPRTGLLHQIRPAFGGNLMATIVTPEHRPQMASVRPGVMKAPEAVPTRKGEIIRHDYSHFQPDDRIRVIDSTIKTFRGESLGNSRMIIGVGRGVKNKETVLQIRRWAQEIGAIVAGSRAAVETGLIDACMQVGQTGQSIAPDLYIAIGISGQIQHTAAITGAKTIIAINPDRSAPIFNVADYGWAIPVEEALPLLTRTDSGMKI